MNAHYSKLVLYVEDNPVNVFLVQAIFAPRTNFRLVTANDGTVGLHLAHTEHPELILLDLNLPDMDGKEFLEKLRADKDIAGIPVVIVSADAMDQQLGRYRALGVSDFITKPFDLDEFEKLIDRYLTAT